MGKKLDDFIYKVKKKLFPLSIVGATMLPLSNADASNQNQDNNPKKLGEEFFNQETVIQEGDSVFFYRKDKIIDIEWKKGSWGKGYEYFKTIDEKLKNGGKVIMSSYSEYESGTQKSNINKQGYELAYIDKNGKIIDITSLSSSMSFINDLENPELSRDEITQENDQRIKEAEVNIKKITNDKEIQEDLIHFFNRLRTRIESKKLPEAKISTKDEERNIFESFSSEEYKKVKKNVIESAEQDLNKDKAEIFINLYVNNMEEVSNRIEQEEESVLAPKKDMQEYIKRTRGKLKKHNIEEDKSEINNTGEPSLVTNKINLNISNIKNR